jgi:hypothetical protein
MTTPRQTPVKTQNDTVKAHMLAGHTIDTWQAYKLYNMTSLAQRIYDLKAAGVVIQSKMVTRNGKTYSLYWIDIKDRPTPTFGHNSGIEKANYADNSSTDIVAPTSRVSIPKEEDKKATDGVWLSGDYIEQIITTLMINVKALNALAELADIKGDTVADEINDASMRVLDIAMFLTEATTNDQ